MITNPADTEPAPEALGHLSFSTSSPSGLPISEPCSVFAMTKIVLKSKAAPLFEVLRSPLGVLLHPSVLCYLESESAIYVGDPYADVTVGRLTQAGVPIEVVKV